MTRAATPLPAAALYSEGARGRVLVVEDNLVNQQLVLAMLARAGHATEVAMNGSEALALLRTRRVDLVLMDLQMPVMDGLQATREIRRPGSGVLDPAVPVIALTADTFAEDLAHSVAAGMDGFLAKPVDPRRLLDSLAKWMPAPAAAVDGGDWDPAVYAGPVAAADDVAALPVLDRGGLLDRAMDDEQLAAELLEAFLREMPALRSALRTAIGAHDAIAVMNAAHTLKGAAGNAGAMRVARVAACVEQQAATDPARGLGDAFLELDLHLMEFERAVHAQRVVQGAGAAS